MHLLASGRCALDSGPVGRCSSRGWIGYVKFDEIGRGVYELTASGRGHLLDSGAKRNEVKRSGFGRPFQARQARLGMAS
jgi:hypothetical protein